MASHAAHSPLSHVTQGLGVDVGLPLAAYYGTKLLGADDWAALLAATVVAGVRTLYVAIRARTLNPFSTIMLLSFGIGLVLAFASGDPQVMILKDSVGTFVVGGAFLVSTVRGRPLTLEAYRTWSPERAASIDEAYATNPRVRHSHKMISTVWGVGLLAEATIRVPLVFLLPVSVMVGLSTVMQIVAVVALVMWSRRYVDRAKQREGASAGARVA